jgi:hypothetical protein
VFLPQKTKRRISYFMKSISHIIGGGQMLLPVSFSLQEYFEEYLDDEHKQFLADIRVIESAHSFIERTCRMGRPPYPEYAFRRAFYAQCKFGISTIEELRSRLTCDSNLRLICGFKMVPSLSTFCRRLNEMAAGKEADIQHECMIRKYMEGKIILHVNRDSTAIEARQRTVKTKTPVRQDDTSKYKRGRPHKNEHRADNPPSRLEVQQFQSPELAIMRLDRTCRWGCKINSQGNRSVWKGYKLHLDVSDTGIPLTAVVTGANVHDSQLAIPMEKLTERRCTFLYSLMDSAYDAGPIHCYIKGRGRIPVIDPHKRRNGECAEFDSAKKQRFKIRTTVERANANIKDWLLPKRICVRSSKAAAFILMTSVIMLTAEKLLQNDLVPA